MKNIQVFKPLYRKEEILKLIGDCCDLGWTGIGGNSDLFESKFKEYTGHKTCLSLNSATAALHLAVLQLKMDLQWQDGDEILTTPLTFVSSNNAILYCNMRPVFCDIDEYGCLDPQDLLKKITPKTKAIIFVALGGNIGQLKEVIKISKVHNIPIILDSAHACGTRYSDTLEHIGVNDGVAVTCYSYQAVKNCPGFDAGSISWNYKAEEMDKLSRKISWLGISKDTYSRTNSKEGSYKWDYSVDYCGFKYNCTSVAASFLLVSLKYVDQDNAYRRHLADLYTKQLADVVEVVPTSKSCITSRHLFQILVDKRDEVMLALNQYGIYPGVHYKANHLFPIFKGDHSCEKSELFSNRTITLPCHMHMTVDDVKYICDSLVSILKSIKT